MRKILAPIMYEYVHISFKTGFSLNFGNDIIYKEQKPIAIKILPIFINIFAKRESIERMKQNKAR